MLNSLICITSQSLSKFQYFSILILTISKKKKILWYFKVSRARARADLTLVPEVARAAAIAARGPKMAGLATTWRRNTLKFVTSFTVHRCSRNSTYNARTTSPHNHKIIAQNNSTCSSQRQHAAHFFHCFYLYFLHFVHKIATTSIFSLALNTDNSFSILKSLFTTYFQDRIRSNLHLSTLLGTILNTSILDRDIFFHLVIFLCSSSFSLLLP